MSTGISRRHWQTTRQRGYAHTKRENSENGTETFFMTAHYEFIDQES